MLSSIEDTIVILVRNTAKYGSVLNTEHNTLMVPGAIVLCQVLSKDIVYTRHDYYVNYYAISLYTQFAQ